MRNTCPKCDRTTPAPSMGDTSDHAPLCSFCESGDVLVSYYRRGNHEGTDRVSLSGGGLPEVRERGKYTYRLRWFDAGEARYESDDPAGFVR